MNRVQDISATTETQPSNEEVESQKKNKNIVYAFISFRSMDGVKLFNRAYEEDKSFMSKVKHWCNVITCRKDHHDGRLIGGVWPYPREPVRPDNIYWRHISTSENSRKARRALAMFIGFVLLWVSVFSILYVQVAEKELGSEYKIPKKCPPKVTKI